MTDSQLRMFGLGIIREYERSKRNGGLATEDGELLTTDEAMKRLKVSRASLDRMTARREIRRRKVGGCWRYEAQSIDEYFAKQDEAL